MNRKQSLSHVRIPSIEEVEVERKRLRYSKEYRRVLKSTIYALLVVAAVAVLLATLFLPVLQVSGTSMEPTLEDGEIVILIKDPTMETGDLCGFYWQNKLLLKRIIGKPGDIITMDADGTVYVNAKKLEEPYITGKSIGECDISFPFQVPDKRYFVMGDHRDTSIDSRSSAIGTIEADQMVGRILLRIWPIKNFNIFN